MNRRNGTKDMSKFTKTITITALTTLLAAAAFVGCAHGTSAKSMEILETKIGELESQVASLKTTNDHLCGALAESSMMGMIQYLGGAKFLVRPTGQVKEAEGFLDDCSEAMRSYGEEIEKRNALLKAQEEVAGKASEDAEACQMGESGEGSCSCDGACDCDDACGGEGDSTGGDASKAATDAPAEPKTDTVTPPAASTGEETKPDATPTGPTPASSDATTADSAPLKIQLPLLK